MKCHSHRAEAVAVCAYCGRAVCPDCLCRTDTPVDPPLPATTLHGLAAPARMACSNECAAALARNDEALRQLSTTSQQLLQQSRQSARASAFYCYLCAALSAGAAVVAWFMLPSPFLILFTAGCSIVLIISGLWYSRVARKRLT
ncbi:MAG TPA: hypothetical protein VN578_13970 [Candidatus Binatia bacterium]|jgi:hypothetical protein|nr:hypothetical protein [Candidatus Binatia bacterium]